MRTFLREELFNFFLVIDNNQDINVIHASILQPVEISVIENIIDNETMFVRWTLLKYSIIGLGSFDY